MMALRPALMRMQLCIVLLLTCGLSAAAAPPARETIGNRTTENVPPVPDELSRALDTWQMSRGALFGGWLADGSMAILTRFGETAQVHRVTQPLGMREQLTFDRDAVYLVTASPRQGTIYFLKDEGGAENWQLHALDPVSRRTQRLSAGGNVRNESPILSADGNWLAWTSTERNGVDSDVWIMDTRNRERRRVTGESGAWWPLDFSPDGRSLLVMRYIAINHTRPAKVDLATGNLAYLQVDGDRAAISAMRHDADGGVLLVSDEGTEFRTLRHHDPATGVLTQLSGDIPWDVEFLDVAANGRIAFVTNEDGFSRLHVLEGPARRPRDLPRFPDGVIESLDFDASGDHLAFTLNTPTSPRDVHVLDLAENRVERWTRSELGAIDPAALIAPELIRFPTFDTVDGRPREIPAFYYRPRGEGPFPVIIRIHGGPEGQELPLFNPHLQYLVNVERIAILLPNVRGSAGYGKTFLDLDNGKLRKDPVRDIGALIDWIGRQPELDASRIGVTGGSYGGYMTLATLIDYGDRLRAGSELFGISDFRTFLTNTSEYRRDLRRAEYGDERDPSMARFFDEIAPLRHAGRIRTPLLVAQGANDPRVPQSESEQIVAAVRDTGQDVWYVLFDDEGHGFVKKPNVDYNNAVNVMFWRRYLIGHLPGEPSD